MKILWNIWPLERSQGFSIFRPTDLVFDGTWPSFELDLDIIKMNILTNIHKDPMKNVTSRVVTSKSLRTHRRTTDTARSQKLTLSLCDRWAKKWGFTFFPVLCYLALGVIFFHFITPIHFEIFCILHSNIGKPLPGFKMQSSSKKWQSMHLKYLSEVPSISVWILSDKR